jgi:cardiolipin synthase
LPFPARVPSRCGNAIVQVQRTIHSGRYSDAHPTPGGAAFNIAAGERAIFDQYRIAIAAARRSIYIENQSVSVAEIVDDLRQALRRGVDVVLVLPAEQMVSEDLAALDVFENFTLAGIAGQGADGLRKPVWVHAKLMVVDGEWATVGSCNLHRFSLFGNGEMNAAFWEPGTAHALLTQLLQEHLDRDTSALDDRSALQLFRAIARENRARFESGDHTWQGHQRVYARLRRAMAKRSGALLIRDRRRLRVPNDPGSAAHHSASLHAALRPGNIFCRANILTGYLRQAQL